MIEPGQRFGELTTIKETDERVYQEKAWLCRCSCGKEVLAGNGQLRRGDKKSCGCLRKRTPANALDLTDKLFGKLTVIERAGRTENGNALWLCQCECGNTTEVNATTLRRGEAISCGCSRMEHISKAKQSLKNTAIEGVQVPLLTRKVRSDSGTGHKGVYRRVRRGRECYEARITIKGTHVYLGTFSSLDDAILARKAGEERYHKPYLDKWEDNK